MNITKFVPNAVSRNVARQLLVGQKHSPAILFGAGVVGMVTTVVLASRATLKLEEVLEEAQSNQKMAAELTEQNREDYTEEDYTKDVAYIRVRTGLAIAKLYGPAFFVGAASVFALTGSHVILTKRNAGLVAAYAAVEKAFAQYQDRVRDELGEEKEFEIRRGIVTERVDNPKDGTVDEVKVATGRSPYARIFDSNSKSWSPQPDYNITFLRAQQNWCTDLLVSRGHLFLNEVYDNLGLERTKEGSVTGWVFGKGGDDYVDFGIFNGENDEGFFNFVTGREGAILLDFNVDGVIWNKI